MSLKISTSVDFDEAVTEWPASDFYYLRKFLGKPAPGFPNDLVRWKIALIGRFIRHLGDAYTETKGQAFESTLTRAVLKQVSTAYHKGLPLKMTWAGDGNPLWRAPESLETPSKRTSQGIPGNESDDDYPGVLFKVANRWRVILCKDRIQFILQYRVSPAAPRSWRGKSFPTTRESLRDSVERLVGAYVAEFVSPQIDALPDHILDLER